MHILTLRREVIISPENIVPAGVPYLCEDTNGAQLMTHANGGRMEPLKEIRRPIFAAPGDELVAIHGDGSGLNDGIHDIHRLLFVRVGGLGDLTLLTPILREIHRRWPTVKIDVACHKEFGQAIEHLPYCTPVQFPLSLATAQTYDGWVFLENAIEGNEDAKTLHSVDAVAKMIGLSGDFNKVQDYVVTDREKIWQEVAFPRTPSVRRIAIQFAASARCRTYPQAHTQRVIQHFLQKGWEVFMMGHEGSLQAVENEPKNFIKMTDGYTFRQRAAVLATCDIVLAPDSSLTHIAGALDVPCVALYGPFPWLVRTRYNPLTRGINGKGKCAPCFHHQHMREFFPKHCPSANRNVCAVMESIKPERVIAMLLKYARNASEEETKTEVPEETAPVTAEVVSMLGAATDPVQQ